ncbi:MAG: hypothetical protein QHH06_07125 [Clostridiales bacterium]|jgi:hypothetical protein|nr:hypothetical protein [Eubacteriales bacterium]MDH7566239.1 hypothetical protein [Clostridiales bacterium]
MKQDPVFAAVKKLRNRLWLEHILRCSINALLAWALCALALAAAAHAVILVQVLPKCAFAALLILSAGLAAGLLMRPGLEAAARAGDALGLMDRLSTYLEYREGRGPVLEAFREEVRDAVEGFRPAERYRLRIGWRRLLAALLLAALSAGVFFIPSANTRAAALKQQVHQDLKEEAENVARLAQQAEQEKEEGTGEGVSRDRTPDILRSLQKKLAAGYSYEEAALNVSAAQKELEARRKEAAGEDLKGLAGIFDGMGSPYREARALLESGKAEDAAKAVQALSLTGEEQQRMLDNIRRLQSTADADSTSPRGEALEKLKAAAEKGVLDGQKLSDAFTGALAKKQEPEAADEAEAKLQSLKERLMAKGREGFDSDGRDRKSSAFTEGENAGMKDGEAGGGSPSGTALGEAGNTAVRSPDGKGGGGVSDGSGGDEKGREGQVDRSEASALPAPEGGSASQVKGKWQEGQGDIKSKQSDRVAETAGQLMDRDSLYRQFKQEGMEYVSKYEIPSGEKPVVLEYFNRLNGGN